MDLQKVLATAFKTYEACEKELEGKSRVVGPKPHPLVYVQAEAFKQIAKCYALLSKTEAHDDAEDPLEKFMVKPEYETRKEAI